MSKRSSLESSGKGSTQNIADQRSHDRDRHRDEKRDGDGSKKPKLSFSLGNSTEPSKIMGFLGPPKKAIKIQLGAQKPAPPQKTVLQSRAVAAAFNVDEDDDEPEEMPPEARMRMRNIGRETPTSAGPNSFGKTKQGFCDNKKMFEKTMKKAMDGSTIPPPQPLVPENLSD